MSDPSVLHNTFVIERSYPVSPEKVFAALSDPAKKRRWYGDSDHRDLETFEIDFRVGGAERNDYRLGPQTPFPGVVIANDGHFHDIVTNERVVLATHMTMGGKLISVSLITFELLPTAAGTDLLFTHQGIFYENSGGVEMRKAGWNSLFDRLAKELGQ